MRDVTPDLVEIRKASFRQALIDAGRPDDALAERLSDVYFEHRWAPSRPFGDVRPALEALAPRYRLGIISNGNTYPERFGLGHLFSFGVYAQDHGGINKPDPRLFQIAIHEAGCQPHELLHVGDSLRSDVEGAKRVGAWVVWVNRDGATADGEHQPDFQISLNPIPETAAGYLSYRIQLRAKILAIPNLLPSKAREYWKSLS